MKIPHISGKNPSPSFIITSTFDETAKKVKVLL